MTLTNAQRAALKAYVQANSDTNQAYIDGNLTLLADLLNALNVPDFFVWRTDVTREDIYNNTSVDNTNWSWVFYKSQNVTEQNAWVQMFMGDVANFSKANLRAGIANIFTAGSAVNATHALAIGKRKASRVEKVFANGTGSAVSPATMVIEGTITTPDLIGL